MPTVLIEPFCEHGGWIRVWHRDGAKWSDEYDYHTGYKLEKGYAVIKGFSEDGVSREEYELIIRTVNEKIGYLVTYDRYNRTPPVKRFQLPLWQTKGKIRMATEEIHHTDLAKNEDGEIDTKVVIQSARHALDIIETTGQKIVALGQYTFKTGEEHPAVEDVLDGYDGQAGDEIYIFARRPKEVGPGEQGENPPRS